MCFSRLLICIQNIGFTFGSSHSSPHILFISLQAHSLLHLVEKLCNCHVVSVNSLVAKWRRSADSLLCLPSPPVFSASSLCFHFLPLGGGMELVFLHSLTHLSKRKGRKESPLCLNSHMAQDCPRLDVLWENVLGY